MTILRSIALCLAALLCSFSLPAYAGKNVDTSLEESLALRRISEYWKERDYKTAKSQIEAFLSRMPKSQYADRLWAMLGDLSFQEKDYEEAIAAYDQIRGEEFHLNSLFRLLHSLYETGRYEEFVLSAEPFFKNSSFKADEVDLIHFELAQASFFLACKCKVEKEREEWLMSAVKEYQIAVQTKYGDLALSPLAKVYTLLEEYPKAVSLYLLLSQKEPEKKEEHLFQAAALQLHCNRPGAILTFGEIVEMGGVHAGEAAFNQLHLLFQDKRYRDFILAYDKSFKYILADQITQVRYLLGQSLFQTKDFANAAVVLSLSLDAKCLSKPQEKSALLSLVSCAKEGKDLALFEKGLTPLKREFAEDEETLNSLLMHIEVCREKQQWAKARGEIRELLTLAPKHPKREALLYDEAILLLQEEKWEESSRAFETLMAEFPRGSQRASSLRHLVLARQESCRGASLETEMVKKQQLLEAIEQALEEPKAFASIERQKLRYQLGKIQYQLCQYDEAIETLSCYLVDFGTEPHLAEGHLLLAYSHLKGSRDQMQFVLSAERALSYNPIVEGALDARLTLFNTYLELAQRAASEDKKEMIEKAAEHLFFSLDRAVSKENQKWLAAYYCRQHEKGHIGAAHRAAFVLEKLLGFSGEGNLLHIDAETLDKEAEAIKLSHLYEKMGRFEQRACLLEALIKEQEAHPHFSWKYQRMAQFELGKTYLLLGSQQMALNTFTHLIETSSHLSSFFAIAAELEKAKLEFAMLGKRADPKLNAIYDTLKDVQSKRKLHSEPLHLEAALTYIAFKTQRSAPEEQLECAQFYLRQMKENFTSSEDPLVQNYLSAAPQFPDKENLFYQYLAYVDAEIMRLEGIKIASEAMKSGAKQRFALLLADCTEATLTERIQRSMEAL